MAMCRVVVGAKQMVKVRKIAWVFVCEERQV